MNMQQMMAQAQKMQRELKKAQDALNAKEFERSQGGMVTVKMLGSKEIVSISIEKDALEPDNKEMIEDTIKMLINQISKEIDAENEAINEKITGRGGLF